MNHAAVVMEGDKIIVIGGFGSARNTGTIVKGMLLSLQKLENIILLSMINN